MYEKQSTQAFVQMIHLICFMSFVISFEAVALTCSKKKLEPFFVGGLLHRRGEQIRIASDIDSVLTKSTIDLDQKGLEPTTVILTNYFIYADELIKAAYKVARARVPLAEVGRIVAMHFFGQVDDFFRYYNDGDLEALEKNLEKWIQDDGFYGHAESRQAVYDVIKPRVTASDKILLIGFGVGSFATNGAILRLGTEIGGGYDGLLDVAHLMISPPRKSIGRFDLTPFNYLSLNQDSYQAYQNTLVGINNLVPNLNLTTPTRTSLFYGGIEIYLSDDIVAGEIGVATKSKTMRAHFYDFSRRALDQLVNNDFNCCGIRAGALITNYTGCPFGKSSCLGGFVEKGILYDKSNQQLRVEEGSTVCKSQSYALGKPSIFGNVDIRGKLILGDSAVIEGGSSFSSPIYLDSLEKTIELRGTTKIKSESGKAIKIKGSILSSGNTLLTGKLDITGVDYPFHGKSYKTAFNNALVTGKTVIAGPVLLSGKVHDSEIVGGYDSENILFIDPLAEVETAKISGIGTIAGIVKEHAVIEGERFNMNAQGVVLCKDQTAKSIVTGQGTKLKGAVYVTNGSVIKGGSVLWSRFNFYGSGFPVAISVSSAMIDSSKVTGIGLLGSELDLVNSEIEGCGFAVQYTDVMNSKLYDVSYHSTPLMNEVIGIKENAYARCLNVKNYEAKGSCDGINHNWTALHDLFGF